MERMKKRHHKWTKDLILAEAKKYEYRSDFKESEPNLYKKICEGGYLDEAFSHMRPKPKKWLKQECVKAAGLCKTKSEFQKRFCGAYKISKKNGWFDECIKNLFPDVGSKTKRYVYAYEFSDKSVYVGLTYNLEKRQKQHESDKNSAVFQHKKMCEDYSFIVKSELVDYKEASVLEGLILEEYVKKGWLPLNRTKTGGLGSTIEKKEKKPKIEQFVWTDELLETEAKKYTTKRDFLKYSPSAYTCAHKKKLIDKICKHMVPLKKIKWSYEEAAKIVSRYDNKTSFRKEHPGLYSVCQQKGWIPMICAHMRNLYLEKIIYTEKNVKDTLQNYSKMEDLRKSKDKFVRGCYWWLKRQKLLVEFKKYLKNEND